MSWVSVLAFVICSLCVFNGWFDMWCYVAVTLCYSSAWSKSVRANHSYFTLSWRLVYMILVLLYSHRIFLLL